MTIEATPPSEQQTTLRSNAIGLPGVLFQSVTTMALAGAVAFSLGAAIPFILPGVVIYFQFVPLPAAPFNQVGPIDAAWLILGIIVVILLSLRSPQVLRQGTMLFAEEPEEKETA